MNYSIHTMSCVCVCFYRWLFHFVKVIFILTRCISAVSGSRQKVMAHFYREIHIFIQRSLYMFSCSSFCVRFSFISLCVRAFFGMVVVYCARRTSGKRTTNRNVLVVTVEALRQKENYIRSIFPCIHIFFGSIWWIRSIIYGVRVSDWMRFMNSYWRMQCTWISSKTHTKKEKLEIFRGGRKFPIINMS